MTRMSTAWIKRLFDLGTLRLYLQHERGIGTGRERNADECFIPGGHFGR